MGKMFMDRGATPPTENPHVDPQRERERDCLPQRSVFISRSGVLPRSGWVTTQRELTLIRHASSLTSFQELRVDCCVHERKNRARSDSLLQKLCGTLAPQKEKIDLIPTPMTMFVQLEWLILTDTY